MQAQPHRKFPGEGIAPLRPIVETLASLEMFQTQDRARRDGSVSDGDESEGGH